MYKTMLFSQAPKEVDSSKTYYTLSMATDFNYKHGSSLFVACTDEFEYFPLFNGAERCQQL